MKRNLLIRADANTDIGSGHVMRCLALAQAWRSTGGGVTFLTATDSSMLQDRLKTEGMATIRLSANPGSSKDALQTATIARQVNASWVAVDGYQFDDSYQHAMKNNDLNLLFVDDYGHADHYYADLVLNQNSYAHEDLYVSREPYTRLLLGAKYALLRREFLSYRVGKRKNPDVARKVLVTLGGGDRDNATGKVIQAIQHLEQDPEVVVVIGSNNPHYQTLKALADNSPAPIRLVQNVTDMPSLMAWADIAVSAGGSTCWELAHMGLPAVVMVLAKNQKDIAADLDRVGVVISLNQHTEVAVEHLADIICNLMQDHEHRNKMSRKGQGLVDGRGSERMVQILLAVHHEGLGRNRLCA